jgi:hypothetical protein
MEAILVPLALTCTDFADWHYREINAENPWANLVTPLAWVAKQMTQFALPLLIQPILSSATVSSLDKLKCIKHLMPLPDHNLEIIIENSREMRQRMRYIFDKIPKIYLRALDLEILEIRKGELTHPSLAFSEEIRKKYPTSITITEAFQEVFRQNGIEWTKPRSSANDTKFTHLISIIIPNHRTKWEKTEEATHGGYFASLEKYLPPLRETEIGSEDRFH